VGLAGFGSEGRKSRGYRQRLYARAMVLQDAQGERVALVVADLPFISTLLQRWVAESLQDAGTQIGAERLLLSATHSHSSPGNFLDAKMLNDVSDRQPGFDPLLARLLANRIASAVREAARNLRPACAAWATTAIYGHTRNRSYQAFRRNQPEGLPFPAPPTGLEASETAVNPLWSMLRVDLADSSGGCLGRTTPLGAYSIFAIHGTVNPGENDLLDPDIHGAVERGLEQWIDRTYGEQGGSLPFRPRTVHLLANGTEGDVSPDWPPQSRCPLPELRPVLRPGGPETPSAWDWVHAEQPVVDVCIHSARAYLASAGDTLAERAIGLFQSLDGELRNDLAIAIASATLHLRRDAAQLGICARPMVGTSTAAGADDGYSRFYGFRFLGLLPVGIEDGGRAAGPPSGCQREKRTWLNIVIPPRGLPEYAPLTALRLGNRLLLAIPGEPTTMTGVQIQRVVAESVFAADSVWSRLVLGPSGDSVHFRSIVLGHTNGFIQYIATDAEYSAQEYEGGSTLYGPAEAMALARALAHLAAELARAGPGSPPAAVDSLLIFPGSHKRVLPSTAGSPPTNRMVRFQRCDDTVVATWPDAPPASLPLAAGPILLLERMTATGDTVGVAWDDDQDLEVRVLKVSRDGRARWQLRWDRRGRAGPVRVKLLGRESDGASEATSPFCPPLAGLVEKAGG
jgi:neutral ceramidase